ncbi:MAG TPA: hypothetical protein VK308_00295 [Pyrinomonadaceae bacterium]|nr:hypothetical protein [Pyrinomonadaceae bacterium]
MVKIPFQILLLVAISNLLWACGSNQTSDNKEVELLRKETELAKKEAELAKKELEMSKDNNSNSKANTVMPSPSPTSTPTPSNNVTGFWIVRYNSGGFNGRMDLRLKQNGENLIVSSKSYVGGDRGVWSQEPGGKVKNNKITFFLEEKGERASYTGTVENNTMKGTMSFGGTWTAKRQ